MKIAQIAPLWESVPPVGYGGIELIVSLLTDELVRRGHKVTLFASGDSQTLADLEPGCDRALRPMGITHKDFAIYEQMQLGKVVARSHEFDLIHSHLIYAAVTYANLIPTPIIHTLHWIMEPVMEMFFQQHQQQNYISISNSQRRPELGLNYIDTVYNSIPIDRFTFHPEPKNPPYLAFLGRMSESKGPHLAIEIAKRTGLPLKMAGKVDLFNQEFYDTKVEPLIDNDQIQCVGEITPEEKNDLLGGAIATLFPIQWREPFGLVMAESMACGTPVIATNCGAAPEVVADGETGFICEDIDGCVEAIDKLSSLSRRDCRERVQNHFSVGRMVDGYEAVYRQILAEGFAQNGRSLESKFAGN
jgi:glycosyltransferase involved in cell wall biosynthesis